MVIWICALTCLLLRDFGFAHQLTDKERSKSFKSTNPRWVAPEVQKTGACSTSYVGISRAVKDNVG